MANPSLIDSVTSIAKFTLDYAIVLAALGVLTMAFLEAWKKLRDSQAKFHRSAVLRWIRNDPSDKSHYRAHQPARAAPDRTSFDPARCYEELIQLTTGLGLYKKDESARRFEASNEFERAGFGAGSFSRSIEYALFELELDRMMGQIQEAADVALNNPNLYEHLFMFLTRGVDEDDIKAWWKCHSDKKAATSRSDADRKELADLYTRIKQVVRRHLDSFQIVTSLRWREWNQLAALVVGAVLMFVAQVITLGGGFGAIGLADWPKMIAIALLGGMLAPVAKDLVDALQKVGKNV